MYVGAPVMKPYERIVPWHLKIGGRGARDCDEDEDDDDSDLIRRI